MEADGDFGVELSSFAGSVVPSNVPVSTSKSSRFWSGCVGDSPPRQFIRVRKLQVSHYGSVPAQEARVHRLGELRHPPLICFKGSQSGSLYYGVCSEQHPSDQGEF